MHGIEFVVVALTGFALVVGAAMRLFSRRVQFPYTIGMLLAGIALGLLVQGRREDAEHGLLAPLLQGAEFAPDLIIFVFLPALVFESAFAIDVNRFRKNVGAVVLYAGPALVLATLLTAALMMGVTAGSWQWSWSAALVFGALISATDPVAVVAIFSELGVAKRLSVLVEGESLLNDGTAIVVFSLLVQLLTGELSSFSTVDAIVRFVIVVTGGVTVGVVLAFIVSRWIAAMFNDPLSEITLTLVLAYACMVIAEGVLHVSGIMAVVTGGLWMSATGKRAISPEASEFLHRFWHMLGYIANTLIFFLVGLMIARQLERASLWDFGLILLTYIGVMLIRFLVTFAFQPAASRFSEGVDKKDSTVIAWGGLRGAVSLALALLVARNEAIELAVREQLLLLTAGVVLLTILVNGASMKWLLARLGYDQPPLFEQLSSLSARALVLEEVERRLQEVRHSRDLRAVDWSAVKNRLSERQETLWKRQSAVESAMMEGPPAERIAGFWRQVLDIELQCYWEAFANGTLAPHAMKVLETDVKRQADGLSRGRLQPQTSRTDALIDGMLGWKRRSLGFEQVAWRHDLWRAESVAAGRVLANLHTLKGCDDETLESIRKTYQGYLSASHAHLEDLRTNLPEMAGAIETRLARRIELNLERDEVNALERRGVLDHERAHAELEEVEQQMNALKYMARRVEIPETATLVAKTPLFQDLSEPELKAVAELTEEMVLPRGQTLFRQGDPGESLYVVARGALQISVRVDSIEADIDVLGSGDVVGEMALLSGAPRSATAKALTSVTLGKIDRVEFQELCARVPGLNVGIWKAFAQRLFDNHLRESEAFATLNHADRVEWFGEGRFLRLEQGEALPIEEGERFVFLVAGEVLGALGKSWSAVELIRTSDRESFVAASAASVAILREPHQRAPRSGVARSLPPFP